MEPALQELFAEGAPDDEVAVILRLSDPNVVPAGVRIVARFGRIATCRLRRGDIPRIRGDAPVRSMKAPRRYGPTPTAEQAESDIEITAIDQRRPDADLPTGRDVVIAHIDWGADFAHPDFRKPDGRTRLLALWDQSSPIDPGRPNRYGYGRIYQAADIDRALASPDPYAALGYNPALSDLGSGSHGTHTLGISGGNGRGGGPVGLAPEADLVFVHLSTATAEGPTLLGDSVALLEALDFIARTAGARPFVVNASLGRQAGEHDGRTLSEQGMDAFLLESPGRAIVQSTGNYFDRHIHSHGTLRPGERRGLHVTIEEGGRHPEEVDLWYPGVDRLEIAVRGPGGAAEARAGPGERTDLVLGGKPIARLYHRIGDPNNGDNEVQLFLYKDAPAGEWEIVLFGHDVADGRFHAWIERDSSRSQSPARFSADDDVPTSTIGTICNGLRTLAVGAYDAHDPNRALAHFTSSGATRDGRQKPDLVAPGVRVLAARSRPRDAGPDAPLLTRMSGTSMAAPHVTGTIALMFAATGRPLSIAETRRLLLAAAEPSSTDADRTDRLRLGSGYLDTAAAVAAAREAGRAPSIQASALIPSRAQVESGGAESDLSGGPDMSGSREAAAALAEPVEQEEVVVEARDENAPPWPAAYPTEGPAPAPFPIDIPFGGSAPGLAVPVGGAAPPVAVEMPVATTASSAAPGATNVATSMPMPNSTGSGMESAGAIDANRSAEDPRMSEFREQAGEGSASAEDTERDDAAEARRDDPHTTSSAGVSRAQLQSPAPLPFQFDIPITGGAPGIALPFGGAGSPFAFTVPLGGTTPPAPTQPATTPAAAPSTAPAGVQGPMPTSGAAPPTPAADMPVTVAADIPLYVPPGADDTAEQAEAAEQPEAEFGERVLASAKAALDAGGAGGGSSRAFLRSVFGSGSPSADSPGLWPPVELPEPIPSATALFNTFACPAHPMFRRDGQQRRFSRVFEVLARPGEMLGDIELRQGDLLVRAALGEGWATIGIIASPGVHGREQLAAAGLRGEGYPRLAPGGYVHVIEAGPRLRTSSDRFARRSIDGAGRVPSDTLLLRVRRRGALPEDVETAPGETAPASQRPPALRRGDTGPAVREAQQKLNRIHADAVALGLPGLDGCPLPEDGRFTEQTERAVLALQQQVLGDPGKWDGVIGPDTWAQLDLLAGSSPPQTLRQGRSQTAPAAVTEAALAEAAPVPCEADLSAFGLNQRRQEIRRGRRPRPQLVGGRPLCPGEVDLVHTGADSGTIDLLLWNFDIDGAYPKRQHEAALDRLIAEVHGRLVGVGGAPPRADSYTIKLTGFASPTGNAAYNRSLADEREAAVQAYLRANLENFGAVSEQPITPRITFEPHPGGFDPNTPVGRESPQARAVRVIAVPGGAPTPPPRPFPGNEARLRALLDASMLLAGDPSAAFDPGVVPTGRQSGTIWSYDIALSGRLVASNVDCIVDHSPAHSHAARVLEQVSWDGLHLELPASQGGASVDLPFDVKFLLGSFSTATGRIGAAMHRFWRLGAEADVATAVVFAYDVSNPAQPAPITDAATLVPASAGTTPSQLWVLACCELVLNRGRADFEPMGALVAARVYPIIEVLTNFGTAVTRGTVTLRRPLRSGMQHNWAAGGRHLAALIADRNEDLGDVEGAFKFLTGRGGVVLPAWDNLFDYFDKDAASVTRSLIVVDPAKTGRRSLAGNRQVIDRSSPHRRIPKSVTKVPRQGAYDNTHIAPQMLASLPAVVGIPPTPVTMAPVCAHDCFHMHWRWSEAFNEPSVLGWGAVGPYTEAGAPMVQPNQMIRLGITAGVPGLNYEATAISQPANSWMLVMPHGGAFALRTTVTVRDVLNGLLALLPLGGTLAALGAALSAAIAVLGEDNLFALFYFLIQFWLALRPSTLIPRPVVVDVLEFTKRSDLEAL